MSEPLVLGPFRVDLRGGRLLRDGSEVSLRPKAWAVLRYLAENPGRLVTKNELLEAVWPDTAVTEEMAAKCVRELRQALGGRGRASGYVEVLHGRGFRLNIEPIALEAEAADRPMAADDAVAVLGVAEVPLIARSAETLTLHEAIAAAGQRRTCMVAIAGEAGIGKTRLIAEVVRAAAAGGFLPLVGRCYEGEGRPPFWPWAQIVRAALAEDGGNPRNAGSAAAADLLQLLPALPAASPAGSDEHARFQLFGRVIDLLAERAARQPLAIVLEDVHWIDSASLVLLQAVVREIRQRPLLLLASYRDTEGSATAVLNSVFASLARDGLSKSIRLAGLAENETAMLLEQLAQAPVDPELARSVRRRTAGNPYFCIELWRHLVDEGAVALEHGRWRLQSESRTVPEGIVATLERRIARLPQGGQALLAAAAVSGVDFDLEVARAAADAGIEPALDVIDAALQAGIVAEQPERAGAYRFTHALAAETLYHRLNAVRRTRLHWRTGEELERRGAGESPTQLAAIADHLLRGVAQGDLDKAVRYARLAAAQASAACGYEAAARDLDRALAAVAASSSAADGGVRADLLLESAENHARAGNGNAARLRFEDAAVLAESRGDLRSLARAAFGMATRWTFADANVIALLERTASAIGNSDRSLGARLLARLAQSLYLLPGSRPRREQLCEQALALAQAAADPRLLGCVLSDCLEALLHADNLGQLESMAAALWQSASEAGDLRLRLEGHVWRVLIAMSRGRLREAAAESAQFLELAEQSRQPEYRSIAHSHVAAGHIARGELAAAEERARTAAQLGSTLNGYSWDLVAFVQMLTIRREQARIFDLDGEPDLRFPVTTGPAGEIFTRSARWQRPFALSEQGELAQAESAFRELMRNLADLPAENARNTRLPALAAMADVAARLGDADAAARLLPLMAPYVDLWVVVGIGNVVMASVQNALGSLTGTIGRYDESIAHFERAIAEHQREGAVVAQARTLANYARMLLRRGTRSDRIRARQSIDRGLQLAVDFNLRSSADKLHQLRPA
ncbi:MAG TPA: AAA family ATPase [Terriglobales bacterium]|nr:AAA family ATPase [Terriglobales bacterium]